jgi:hypothetical protein
MTDAAARERSADYRLFAGLCIGFFFVVLVPILLAGRPCNDDLARSVLGSYGWVDSGRYLSNILMRALALGASRATDIAPIPQFLAILSLSFAGVLLARRFEIASLPLGILVTLPLGTQPFFLQNLSYRFDAVTMAAALLCAVGAIAMRQRPWRSWILGILALLASLNFYQPAFNVFLVLAVFELARQTAGGSSGRDIVRTAALRFSQALIAIIVYKLLFTSGIKDWVADHGETIHSIDALPVVASNALGFVRYVREALGARLASMFLVLTVLAALPMIASGVRRAWRERSMSDAALRSIFLLLWPVLALLASIGPMLLLIDPVFAPRVFPANGALISASLISAACAGHRGRLISRFAASVCLIVSAITAGAYSSAAGEQMKFEDTIASTMQDDLAQLTSSAHLSRYVLIGSAGYAPAAQHTITQFPIVERLIEPYLVEDRFFTKTYLLHFRQPSMLVETGALSEPQRRAAFDGCATPIVLTRSAYRIRIVDDFAVVDFRPIVSCGN